MKKKPRRLSPILIFTVMFTLFCITNSYAGFKDITGATPVSPSIKGKKKSAPKISKYKPGELVVKYKKGVKTDQKKQVHKKFKSNRIKMFKRLGIEVVTFDPAMTVEEAVEAYKADPAVEYAEPNFELHALETTPADPYFWNLWGLNNTGQTGGLADADIDAPAAWDFTTGSSDVVVAVVDTGIDYTHVDLAANMWVNETELNGATGVDDDGNGYVDDIYGIDTANGDSDPMDDQYHGTHCAGTIGAVGDNGIGVTGVNWNVKLMACKFLGQDGSGFNSDAIECLEYVKAMKDSGVNIVATSNSWGCNSWFCESEIMSNAIRGLMESDVLFIAAAGNNSWDNDRNYFYPANYDVPNILAIAATDHNDGKASFSNWGRRSVHIGAPGVDINSTKPHDTYGLLSGTSMATPHVAGLAALLKADDPSRNWIDIKNLILTGGDPITALANKTITGKRINAAGSLTCGSDSVFSVIWAPGADPSLQPPFLTALSIQCGEAVGPVTISNCDEVVATMLDDGVAPDQAAGDGIFTTAWTPSESTPLFFTSPIGYEAIYAVFAIDFKSLTPLAPAEPGFPVDMEAVVYGKPCESSVDHSFEVTYPDLTTQVVCDWQSAATCTWDTTGQPAGDYVLTAKARVNPSGAEVFTTEDFQLTTAAPAFSINDVIAGEYGGNISALVDQGNAAFTVSLSRSSVATYTVNYTTSNGSATANEDFLPVSGTLTFNPGERSKTINVTILDDEINEDDEIYYVLLNSPSGDAVISDGTGMGTIIDDLNDGPKDLIMTDISFVAGEGTTLTLHNTVMNQREENIEEMFYVGFYLSVDDTVTTDDIFLGHRIVDTLAAGESNTHDTLVWIPDEFTEGLYYIGAIADYRGWIEETDETNNSIAGAQMQVPPLPEVHDPDFHVAVDGSTVTLTVDNVPADYAKIYVYWGDRRSNSYMTPFISPMTHTYSSAGTYDIEVRVYTYNWTQIWYTKDEDPDLGGIVIE